MLTTIFDLNITSNSGSSFTKSASISTAASSLSNAFLKWFAFFGLRASPSLLGRFFCGIFGRVSDSCFIRYNNVTGSVFLFSCRHVC